jgi:hypothetical protein
VEEPEQTGPPPVLPRPWNERGEDERSEDAGADERTSPSPYAEDFAEWVADETDAPNRDV